jgi:hypothetical protein
MLAQPAVPDPLPGRQPEKSGAAKGFDPSTPARQRSGYATNLGIAVSTNRKNRVLGAPATTLQYATLRQPALWTMNLVDVPGLALWAARFDRCRALEGH